MRDFSEQLKKLPESPGVYIMKDERGNILYIGKSKALKKRVSSYFQNLNKHPLRIHTMVINVYEFEYILTDTEMEALILEANLIKRHKPRFNVLLKDDKGYPYIKVTVQEPFPRVFKTRQVFKDKARYFGPYTSADTVNRTIEIIQKLFPIRKCSRDLTKISERPCLNFHIHQCLGPCMGTVNVDAYRAVVDEILEFLSGKTDPLLRSLEVRMQEAAATFEFEKAAEIRDNMAALQSLRERQKMVSSSQADQDIIHLAQQGTRCCMMIFFVRNGCLIGREHYVLEDSGDIPIPEILSTFVEQFYSGTAYVPSEILFPEMPEEHALITEWLQGIRGHKVRLVVPERGEKRKLVDLVGANAAEYLEKFQERMNTEEAAANRNMDGLQRLLNLEHSPRRIESYDISSLTGLHAVGSMVVYESGRKKNSDYRRFKIRTVEGPNDVGSMQEVLFRRFRRGLDAGSDTATDLDRRFGRFPDLILIDGGKGQVHAVEDVLKALELSFIPVVGMVKDDSHRTRELYFNGAMYDLGRDELYRFVAGIQEEVHRFAITYHRALRGQTMSRSALDDIPGIGTTRRNALLAHFKTMDAIRNASVEELAAVPGMNIRAARILHETLNNIRKGDEPI